LLIHAINNLCTANDILLTNFRMLAAGGCGPGFPVVSRPFATLFRKLLCKSSIYCFSVSHINPAYTGQLHNTLKSCHRNSNLHFSKNFQTGSEAHIASYSMSTGVHSLRLSSVEVKNDWNCTTINVCLHRGDIVNSIILVI
jgi:hypothetical protein